MRSLQSKITLSYLVLVAITVAISVFAAVQFSTLSRSIGRILRDNYRGVLAAENMRKALDRQENAHLTMQFGDGEEGREVFLASRDEFYRWYLEGLAGAVLPEEPVLLDSISATYEAYMNASDSLYRLFQSPDADAPQVYREAVVRPLVARLRMHTASLLEVNEKAMLATREQVEDIGDTTTKGIVAASALAVVLSLLAVVQFARNIVRPIGTLTDTIRRIGRGQIGQKLDITSDDEIAELEREVNKMTKRLQAYEDLNVQQLISEKKKTESLVQTMPNPVIVTDQQDRVLLVNRAAIDLLGLRERAWQERPLSEVVVDESLLRHMRREAAGDGEAYDHVLRLAEKGETRYYRRRQVPIHNIDGGVELTVTMLEDVTRFKELDQLKSDFLAAVSHELRTPLTSVGMAVDILLQEVPGPLSAMQHDLLTAVRDDSERLKKLVSSLLNLARLESGTYRPARDTVVISRIVQDAIAPLLLPFREKRVRLEIHVPTDLRPVVGDAEHLGWVVTNLVGNALRYSPKGGTVSIEAFEDDDVLHVSVADTGSGIPPGSLESIFDKFVQIKPSNQTTPGSVGLGLALAKRVVEAHEGRIWAESEPGAGSVFHFTIPHE